MAEKDTEGLDEKSLELPSLFGRKKKRGSKESPAPAETPAEPTPATTAPASGSGSMPADATLVTEPVGDPVDDTVVVEPVGSPGTSDPVGPAPAEPAPAEPAAAEPAPAEPAPIEPAPVEPAARTAEPTPAPASHHADRLRAAQPEPTDAPTRPLASVNAPAPTTGRGVEPSPVTAATTAEEPARTGGARKARRVKPDRSLPPMRASLAAHLVGALVGLLGVGLTWGSLQACDALTGTDSCGGPGLLVVLLVVVAMIMVGSALLRTFGVSEPGGLSFLGVAIFVAICLVFLVENLLDPWMIVAGPVLCALGYGTAHWVVNRFNTELLTDDGPEAHDVR